MGKRGQKYSKYSEELKYEIVNKYLNGLGSSRSLAQEYQISYKTIENMIYTFKRQGHLHTQKKGRPISTKEIDYKERYEILKKYQTFLKAQREKK